MTRFMGFDLALNHGAAVEITNGEVTWFAYYTDSAGAAKRHPNGTRLIVPSTVKDRQARQMTRLGQIEQWIDKDVLVPRAPDFGGIEDYAIRAEQGAHYMGEVGGIARILLWFRGIPFRLTDPLSVKMFATTDGTAQKDLVERCVGERWPKAAMQFDMCNPPPASRKPTEKNPSDFHKVNRTTSEDLADALTVAEIVEVEYKLRAGTMLMSDLDHPKRIQVFNRITKTYPVNILGREWIHNPNGAPTPHGNLRTRVEARIVELEAAGAPGASRLLKELLADGS